MREERERGERKTFLLLPLLSDGSNFHREETRGERREARDGNNSRLRERTRDERERERERE